MISIKASLYSFITTKKLIDILTAVFAWQQAPSSDRKAGVKPIN